MPLTVAFTGNRDYSDRAALYRGLDKIHADKWYFGGARGADSDALEYISRSQPNTVRVVVVPNTVKAQPISVQPGIRRNATEIIELRNTGRDRFQIRNKFMVDRADQVFAFTDGRKSGGTFNTVQYANSQKVPVDTILYSGVDLNNLVYRTEADVMDFIDVSKQQGNTLMSVKGIVIRSLTFIPRASWPAILSNLHTLD